MSNIRLSPAKQAILAHAIHNAEGRIEWFPDNIKGGARRKVIDSLFNHALITYDGKDWYVAAEGYDALGMPRPGAKQPPPEIDAELEQDVAAAEANWTPPAKVAPRARENSKQAEVIRMLQRPEGATIRQICEATGWQQHTVRGTFAGAFKKKLGLNLVSEKSAGGERVYRID